MHNRGRYISTQNAFCAQVGILHLTTLTVYVKKKK